MSEKLKSDENQKSSVPFSNKITKNTRVCVTLTLAVSLNSVSKSRLRISYIL